ncbi:hypothetical protein KAI68_08230, partial [bacterium]|nr:hypothetical protein [bacterium]
IYVIEHLKLSDWSNSKNIEVLNNQIIPGIKAEKGEIILPEEWTTALGEGVNESNFLEKAAREKKLKIEQKQGFFKGDFATLTDKLKELIDEIANKNAFVASAASAEGVYIEVIVNATIEDSINASLAQYKTDLENEGYIVTIVNDNNLKTPQELREYLIKRHNAGELNGAVFVGNLPMAEANLVDIADTYDLSEILDLRNEINELIEEYEGNYTQDVEEYKELFRRFYYYHQTLTDEEWESMDLLNRKFDVIWNKGNDFEEDLIRKVRSGEIKVFLDEGNKLEDLFPKSYSDEEKEKLITSIETNYYKSFPFEFYFMDLDGNWKDVDNDGVINILPGESKVNDLEIYIGRIDGEPFAYDEVNGEFILNLTKEAEILEYYFKKNHAWRTGNFSAWMTNAPYENSSLVFIDNEFIGWLGNDYRDRTGLIFDNMTLVSNPEQITAQSYL